MVVWSGLIEWLYSNIFTLSPISSATVWQLGQFYVLYLIVGSIGSLSIVVPAKYIVQRLSRIRSQMIREEIMGEPDPADPPSLRLLFRVPLEDGVFRWLPLMLLGRYGLIGAHFLWAICHGSLREILFALLFGLLFVRLWLGGLWLQAIAIHLLHDIWYISLVRKALEWIEEEEESEAE